MKKIFGFMSFLALAGAFASCQREDVSEDIHQGQEVSLTLSARVSGQGVAEVKSQENPGDGSAINRCILKIFLMDGDTPEPYGTPVYTVVSGKEASFDDVTLITGYSYKLVLWADHINDTGTEENLKTDLHYNTADLPAVSLADAYSSNDDTRDAFYAVCDLEKVTGSVDQTVTLRRPFGQLNIITADYEAVNSVSSSLAPEKVKLEFKQIPTGMNLLDGTLTGNDDVMSGPVDVAEVTDPAQADGAKQLSFDYIFAPETEQKMLSGIKMTFCDENGNELSVTPYEFPDIPLQRNYRTNVSGNLLTKTGDLTVKVNADFEGVSTPEELMDVFETGGSVQLSKDIELTGTGDDVILIDGGSQVQIDLRGNNLPLNGNTLSASDGASLSLTNGTVTGSNLPATKLLVFAAPDGTVLLDGVTMNSEGAGVGLNEKCDNGKLEIRNSTINAVSFAVGTNASTPVYESNTIVIDNSTLTAWSAVLFNIPGTLEITDSEITGANHGVILRGGTATIKSSTLSIAYNENNAASDSEYMHDQDWGSGNAVPYAALTVGNRGSGYQYPSVLTLVDCTLQSIEGAAGEENNPDLFPVMYVYANSGEGMGVTITYDDNTKFTGEKGIVYGTYDNVIVNGKAPDNN